MAVYSTFFCPAGDLAAAVPFISIVVRSGEMPGVGLCQEA